MGYHFIDQLKNIIALESTAWQAFQELKLWVLTVGAIKARAADRGTFVVEIRKSLEKLGAETWDEATRIMSSFVWLEAVYGERCAILGKEVMVTQLQAFHR